MPTKPGDPVAAEELATRMIDRFKNYPRIVGADLIIGVPANPPRTPHNLSELLAERIGISTGIRFSDKILTKARPTAQMKEGPPNEDVLSELMDAYRVEEEIRGKVVVLVDDLLRSGTTLGVIAQELRGAGAAQVLGVVATRTARS